MCFSLLKNIKSLTSKNSGTLIVITDLPNHNKDTTWDPSYFLKKLLRAHVHFFAAMV
jgi:hypothetical protein